MHISVAPSELQPTALDDQVQEQIASEFQPQLLMYRLKNFKKVCEPRVDVSKFTFTTRRIARTLVMCFSEDLGLARDIVQLLGPQDEDVRLQRADSIECAIVEVLLGLIHEQKVKKMKIGDLADLVNCLMRSRGEILEYKAEEIGWKLKGMSLVRVRRSHGSEIHFDLRTSQHVHGLARTYGLVSSYVKTCSECAVM